MSFISISKSNNKSGDSMNNTEQRKRFELIVRNDPQHNNQMLKRHALDDEKYQYDSVQFAYQCFCVADDESKALKLENTTLRQALEESECKAQTVSITDRVCHVKATYQLALLGYKWNGQYWYGDSDLAIPNPDFKAKFPKPPKASK